MKITITASLMSAAVAFAPGKNVAAPPKTVMKADYSKEMGVIAPTGCKFHCLTFL